MLYPTVLSFNSMMNALMDFILENQVVSIITGVFWSIQGLALQLAREYMYFRFYSWLMMLLNLMWVLEQAFDVFSGTQAVYVNDTAGNVLGQTDFMTAVFIGSPIQNAYWYFMLAASALCFFTTIIAVIKSIGEGLSEMKRPVTQVIRQAFQAILTFLMIPTACLAVMKLGSAITKIIASSLGELEDQRLSDIVFVLIVGDNWKSEAGRKICSTGRMFSKLSSRSYFKWRDINYLYGYILVIFMIVVMITIVMQAIMRALMLAILFLTSPWFVSMIPLDGGEKFKSWTRLFVGFSFATFGPVLLMRIYTILLVSIGISGEISFGSEFNPITGWILKLAITGFGLVGAWQSQYLILEITSPETVNLLKQSQFLAKMAGDSAKKAASAAAAYVTGGASKAGEALGGALAGGGGGGGLGGFGGGGGGGDKE